jgi:NADPH:quinone reductase-like Zn-dependent oxidoreductase
MTDTSLAITQPTDAAFHARDIEAPAAVRGGEEGRLKPAARQLPGSGRDVTRLSATMNAVFVRRFGGPDVLSLEQAPIPRPGRGEVLIETRAAGVAFGDTLRRQGLAGAARPPFIPGYDVVGRIAALGPGVSGWKLGERVGAYVEHGGYAQAVLASAEALARVPEGLDDNTAVALVLNYGTAYQMLRHAAEVERGQRVVVTSAAGGVGTAVLDLARALGIDAVGLASPAKHDLVRQFGGLPVDYRDPAVLDKVRAALGGKRADAVFDGIGGSHLWRSRAMTAKGGRVILFGVASMDGRSSVLGMAPTLFALLSMKLLGRPDVRPYFSSAEQAKRRARYATDVGALFAMARDGQIRPLIHRAIALENVADAHRELAAGRVVGKIVIDLAGAN